MSEWFRPAGTGSEAGYDMAVRPGESGWHHTGLLVLTLAAGESRQVETGDCEWIVLPLALDPGAHLLVETDGQSIRLTGRPSVFAGPSDLVYLPRDSSFTVTSTAGVCRVALPHARAKSVFPVRKIEAADVPVELRGAGAASRQVQNFGTPGTLDADSIIACEVITPAGNWSSYPPHKHDEDRDGIETSLEEIYYFEMRSEPGEGRAAGLGRPMGYQRVYGTDDRPIDVLEEVRTGDVVLVPHGWHGPAMAPAGYDMYYLNVMAGPGDTRAWLICDDPAHSWVRDTWSRQDVDPRLPLHRTTEAQEPQETQEPPETRETGHTP